MPDLLICGSCGYLYTTGGTIKEGDTDLCKGRGTIRPLTTPERIFIRQYNELHKDYSDQAKTIRKLEDERDHAKLFEEATRR